MATVKILNYVITSGPGTIVKAYGMDWEVKVENGKKIAVREMDEKTALHWQDVGRIEILNQAAKPHGIEVLDTLTNTPSDYFGCESAQIFRDKVKTMNNSMLIKLAKRFLDLDIDKTVGRDALIDTIVAKAKELAEKKGA